MLFVGGGGYVGEGEHFPALRSEVGEAEPIARRAIVHHIHRRYCIEPIIGFTNWCGCAKLGAWARPFP